jgi:hypothetical protein
MTSTGTKIAQATDSAKMPPARYEINGCSCKYGYYKEFFLKYS